MKTRLFEIRLCLTCNLRYPIEQNQSLGVRCPQCLGETTIISQKKIEQEELMRNKTENKEESTYAVLLDNIRSAWNVGSILRSADGLGFNQAFLCGITPTPENEAVKKTSLRAEDSIKWSSHKNAVELIKVLKNEGWQVWGLEEDHKALEVSNLFSTNNKKTVLIIGNEVTGVDNELLSLCHQIFYIPMQGKKRSLNVAIAFSIAAFTLRQKRN